MRLMTPPTYFKYSECEPGFVFFERGKYIETTIDQKFGQPKHLFEDLDTGERKCLNSAGQLNYCMDQLAEGEICKVVFKGKITLEKGKMAGKEANQFDVFVEDAKPVTIENPNSTNLNDLE